LTDIARGFRPGIEFLRQRGIGCRVPPSDPSGARRSTIRSVASALFVGNWKRVIPALFQAIPQQPPAVSKMR
jgi:hypothetical protein